MAPRIAHRPRTTGQLRGTRRKLTPTKGANRTTRKRRTSPLWVLREHSTVASATQPTRAGDAFARPSLRPGRRCSSPSLRPESASPVKPAITGGSSSSARLLPYGIMRRPRRRPIRPQTPQSTRPAPSVPARGSLRAQHPPPSARLPRRPSLRPRRATSRDPHVTAPGQQRTHLRRLLAPLSDKPVVPN